MSKAVLISIQPYWVFLIIAKKMGWNIGKEKTIEVRKNYPKDENWNKVAKIYCSKDKKSFSKIPKEYQPLMEQFLGKVIGEFVGKEKTKIKYDTPYSKWCGGFDIRFNIDIKKTCLTEEELCEYLGEPTDMDRGEFHPIFETKGFAWHISDLVIYDEPKELDYFRKPIVCHRGNDRENCKGCWDCEITRPFQSWGYVYEID